MGLAGGVFLTIPVMTLVGSVLTMGKAASVVSVDYGSLVVLGKESSDLAMVNGGIIDVEVTVVVVVAARMMGSAMEVTAAGLASTGAGTGASFLIGTGAVAFTCTFLGVVVVDCDGSGCFCFFSKLSSFKDP